MAEPTESKEVAVMMGRLRSMNSGDAFAINHRIRPEALEHVARRIIEMYSIDADEDQILVGLSRIHAERRGSEHFRKTAEIRQALDKRWGVTQKRHSAGGLQKLNKKKLANV